MRNVTHISLILLSFLLSFSAIGQELTVRAHESYQAKDYEKAKFYIDQSIESKEGKEDAQTWLLRAFIFRNLENYTQPDSKIRNEAIYSHEKSIEFDADKNFYQQNIKGIKSLIIRYFNQAAEMIQKDITDGPEDIYSEYKRLYSKYFDDDFREQDIEFYKALGSVFNKKAKKYDIKSVEYNNYIEEALKRYKMVLEIDSLEYNANYNIGSIYYNMGAEILTNMEPEIDIEEMRYRMDKGLELFIKALPYVEIAHKLTPDRPEPITALKGIHHSLNNFEEEERYEKMLESLKDK